MQAAMKPRTVRALLAAALLAATATVAGCTSDAAGQASPGTVTVTVQPSTAPTMPALSTATESLALACGQIGVLPDAGFQATDNVMLDRLGVASMLAMLAKDQDPTLADPVKKITAVQQTFAQTYSATAEPFLKALSAAKAACRTATGR